MERIHMPEQTGGGSVKAQQTLIAEWESKGYTVKLYREPIIVGQPHEYNLIAIDNGNVRRYEIDLYHRAGVDGVLDPDDRWLAHNAPANAARILRRFGEEVA